MNDQIPVRTEPTRKPYLVRLYDKFFSVWAAFLILCGTLADVYGDHSSWDRSMLASLAAVFAGSMLAAWRRGKP